MEVLLQQLMQYQADLLLPFTRISAMMMVMVGLGARTIPGPIKSAYAVAITIMVMPMLPPSPFTNLFSFEMVIRVTQQVMIGSAVGFVSVIFLQIFVIAGQAIAMQSGLGFASMVDPANGMSVPAVGQFFLVLSTLLFWSIDGHIAMIQLIVQSFTLLPITDEWIATGSFYDLAVFGGWMFAAALILSISPLVAMLVINLSFGIMTRAAPQLNIFSIGFPFTMMSGLIVMWITMESFVFHFENNWQTSLEMMCKIIGC
ncbi:flagellar biosynthetic protein FliR [Psychrosphaera saromensis]|uniref:Flagellar biosynthetic protein FliR n=1 Tax=Psychrosphaera saromensis TaxID=716813 RepID=A0A2S7UW97_9GAMM|nr:flagellar biosynthetic protein FliR [Psychrosphaera saromensis]PQJ53782.1 flagellar biosynthetic protein FliR [Psychrosphaera saromensis]GHB62330.1 flagellar biosynthetic protein FliR [Psychrosphaera saromensis]GLQ15428.1 flagellar biosynthetic protein FliR [Psychrosphaera saromensis]